jgi:hypothetical protein
MVIVAVFSCREAAWFYAKVLEALIDQQIEKDKAYLPRGVELSEAENGYIVEMHRQTYQALGYQVAFKL